MTSAEFLAEIRSRGHWRVNLRPVSPSDQLDSVAGARHAVVKATVSLRGWDFPHMPHDRGDGDNTAVLDKCFEASTAWGDKRELWRIYQSSQFVHYKGVRTDWLERPNPYPANVLGVVDNLWHIAETFEFAHRLILWGFYQHGLQVSIGLRNTAGRRLYFDDDRPAETHSPRQTARHKIEFQEEFAAQQLDDPKSLAVRAGVYIYDKFGWDPPKDTVGSVVDELYGLDIGRG